MTYRNLILGGVAAVALISCGKKDDKTAPAAADPKASVASSSSPIDKPFSLKSAEELDVDKVLAIFPEAARPTYEAVSFDAKSGATVVTNLRFIDRDPDDDIDMDGLTIERTEFYGVDLDAVERVKSGERGVDAPMEQIFAKVRMYGISGDAADEETEGAFTVGAFEIDTLRLRQGATFEEEESNAAHFFNTFDLGGLYFKDINLAASDGEESETGFSFALPDLRLVGMGGGKLSSIIANDLAITINQSDAAIADAGAAMGPQGAMLVNGPLRNFIAPGEQLSKVKSMEWRAIDFSGLMAYGLRDEKPPMTARDLIDLGTIKAIDAESFINGKRLSIAPLTTVSAMEFTWLAPSKIRSESKGVKYDFTAYLSDDEEEALKILKQYNFDKVTADSDFVYDWDANKGGASFSSAFASKGMASGDISMSLSGLKLAEIAKLVEAGEANPVQKVGAFNGFSLTFDDDKLMDAIFALSALQTGGSAEDLRQSVPAMMNMAGLQLAMLNPRFTDYIQALGGFIKNGGTLKIEAKPAQPLPIEALMESVESEPQTLPDTLNLTVTTTK